MTKILLGITWAILGIVILACGIKKEHPIGALGFVLMVIGCGLTVSYFM